MNPVMKALTEARLRQISTKDDAMAAVVRQIVGPVPHDDSPAPEVFERWCAAKGVTGLRQPRLRPWHFSSWNTVGSASRDCSNTFAEFRRMHTEC